MNQLLFRAAILAFAYIATPVHAEICKYIDPNGNVHFTTAAPEANWRLLECGVGDLTRPQSAAAKAQAAAVKAQAARPGVKIGMTMAQVINGTSWGKPKSVNKTIKVSGVHEQWVYGLGEYLYFENGVLIAIQTSR